MSLVRGPGGWPGRVEVAARARPERGRGVEVFGEGVDGGFVVEPPSREARPGLVQRSLGSLADCSHLVDSVVELVAGQADAIARTGFGTDSRVDTVRASWRAVL